MSTSLATSRGVERGPSASRLPIIDSARVFATFGVIFTHVVEVQGHTAHAAALGRFGTSFYILAAVLFTHRGIVARGGHPEPPSRLWEKSVRLLRPYVIWSIIYGVLYFRYAVEIGQSMADMALYWGPLAGTSRQLWFLPFAVVVLLITSALTPRLMRLQVPVLGSLAVLGTGLAYWLLQGPIFFMLDRPWALELHLHRLDRFIEELPLVLSANFWIAFLHKLILEDPERSYGAPEPKRPIPRAAYAIFPVLAFVLIEWVYFQVVEDLRPITGGETRAFSHAIGACLFGACFLVRDVSWLQKLAPIGRHTYFIFLSHVVVLDAASAYIWQLPGYGTYWFATICALSIFTFCALLAPVFARVPLLRLVYPK